MNPRMKYFVLKPSAGESSDSRAYAAASRAAMLKFADEIEESEYVMARELREWVRSETP